MKKSLLDNLLAFYEEDPQDPFNIYALALEYAKTDEKQAMHFYDLLFTNYPHYLPAYYQGAAFFAQLEQLEKAERLYRSGIDLALSQNQTKTHQELVRAYQGFLDEWEY